MKRHKLFSKCISVALTICLMMSMVTVGVSAINADGSNNVTSGVSSDMEVSGTNSLGTMLANEIEDQSAEIEKNSGCNIYEITVDGTQATATFDTTKNASLVVGIYNEAGDTLLASGTTDVTSEDTEVTVDIDIEEMPQYFYLKGFLVDKESLKPICTAYNSPNYTQEMQEFFAKTTEDFEEDRVLNIDSSIDNNFAVYNDNVKVIENSEYNQVTSADAETNTYIIENIDESISTLQAGDIFTYDYDLENVLIVKIASITIEGTTATIIGEETDLKEVFDYVKFDTTKSDEAFDYTVDDSTCSEGVTYENQTAKNGSVASGAIDIGTSYRIRETFSINHKYTDDVYGDINLSGTLLFTVDNSVKVYVSLSYSYCELKTDYAVQLNLSTETSSHKKEFVLGCIGVSPIAGVYIELTPKFVLKASTKITLSGVLKGSTGYSTSSNEGFKDLTSAPKFETSINISGSIFVGLVLDCKLKVLEAVVKASIAPTLGVEIYASMGVTGGNSIYSSKRHSCLSCLAGTIYGKFALTYNVEFLNNDDWSLSGSFIEASVKICDFYYSMDYKSFGFTTCPYISYLVNVTVSDSNGCPVSGAIVNGEYTTGENGVAKMYLKNGNHHIIATKDSKTASKTITVNGRSTSVALTFDISVLPDDESLSSLGEVVQVETGQDHSAALTRDGTLYMWGSAGDGRLGEGSSGGNITKPVKINGVTDTIPENSVVAVSLGSQHSAAITKDGSLYMWGDNYYGQLGNGTNIDSSIPIKIMNNVTKVSLGAHHSAAITADGSLYMWGSNNWGCLGKGTTDSSIPIKIMDNVTEVSLGDFHSAAITTDGALYTWGYNEDGRLGIGSKSSHKVAPQKIMDNIKAVSLGGRHSAAISTTNHLYMWGENGYGQLGDGTHTSCYAPQRIAANIEEINLGAFHSAAITTDGALYTWGYNKYGQLGNGTYDNSSIPCKIMTDIVEVSGSGYGFSTIGYSAVNLSYTIALTRDGKVYSWGRNAYGQLGDGTTADKFTPTLIDIKDHTLYLSAEEKTTDTAISVSKAEKTTAVTSGSTALKTATFRGYKANGIYNFYSLKVKNTENPLASDNILYIDQVIADENGSITVNYYPTEDYAMPYEFVTSLTTVDIANATVEVTDMKYNGSVQKVNPTITYGDRTLYEGIDYEIYGITNAINAGEYTAEVCGKGDFVGSITITYTIDKCNMADLDVSHSTQVEYTGSAVTPEVTVTHNDRTLEQGVDYTVEYQNNSNVGIGLVIVKGINNYTGRSISYFDILEATTEPETEPTTEITTQPITEPTTESPTTDLKTDGYYITGDVEMKLSTCGTNKVSGKIALQVGTYKIKLNNNGTLLGYGKTVTDTTGGLTFKSSYNSYMTLNATGGVYTFQVNADTNALVIKHDSNLPTEYLTGDLNTILTPVEGRTLAIGTTYLEAGTYNFKLSIDGIAFGYGKTVNDKTSGSLSMNSKYSSNVTLVATGGTYTFTLNTSTNKLLINHIPAKDEANDNIHLSGDFDLVLDDNGGADNVAIGTVDLEEGTYSFKLYNYGQALTAGTKIADKGTKTLYGNYITPVTLIASGGTYKFSFNKTTNALTVEKA